MDLLQQTAVELVGEIKLRQISAVELVGHVLDRINQLDDQVGAFVSVFGDRAREQARKIDSELAAGRDPGPLAGLPVAIKDNICTSFGTTTCASRILQQYVSPYDAHVVEALHRAGAILVAKTNLDEFAMGSSTETSAMKQTRNPWGLDRVPGGSSGGSAAAVAARMVPAAIGSDTGGSIRQPAAFCGVSGLKPTYGRVSRYGLVAFGSSLDQIGPFGVDVKDVAAMLNVIGGHDPRDSTCVPADRYPMPDYLADLEKGVKGMTIGLPREYYELGGLDPEIAQATADALEVLKQLGAEVIDISLPHTDYAVACYYMIAAAEASSNLARYDGVHYGHRTAKPADYIDVYSSSRAEGFGDEVTRRIMLGTYILSAGYYEAYYLKALKVRTLIKRDFDHAFDRVDLICCPVAPTAAFRIGERMDDPLTMYLGDIYTISANLAGIPALSLPCGFTAENLPVGLQVMGRHFDEASILRAGRAYQQATDWHRRVPETMQAGQT